MSKRRISFSNLVVGAQIGALKVSIESGFVEQVDVGDDITEIVVGQLKLCNGGEEIVLKGDIENPRMTIRANSQSRVMTFGLSGKAKEELSAISAEEKAAVAASLLTELSAADVDRILGEFKE